MKNILLKTTTLTATGFLLINAAIASKGGSEMPGLDDDSRKVAYTAVFKFHEGKKEIKRDRLINHLKPDSTLGIVYWESDGGTQQPVMWCLKSEWDIISGEAAAKGYAQYLKWENKED